MTQARFKRRFRAKEILIKSSHKGGSDDAEASSSSFYKIRWSLKQFKGENMWDWWKKLKFTPMEFETTRKQDIKDKTMKVKIYSVGV